VSSIGGYEVSPLERFAHELFAAGANESARADALAELAALAETKAVDGKAPFAADVLQRVQVRGAAGVVLS
jgi:hypothetical protein